MSQIGFTFTAGDSDSALPSSLLNVYNSCEGFPEFPECIGNKENRLLPNRNVRGSETQEWSKGGLCWSDDGL